MFLLHWLFRRKVSFFLNRVQIDWKCKLRAEMNSAWRDCMIQRGEGLERVIAIVLVVHINTELSGSNR